MKRKATGPLVHQSTRNALVKSAETITPLNRDVLDVSISKSIGNSVLSLFWSFVTAGLIKIKGKPHLLAIQIATTRH